MHLKEGTLLKGDTYRIIRFIASGGFGCTYEAVHLMLNKRVAIKEFFPKTFCNRDADTSHVTVGTQSQHALVKKLKFKFVNEAQSIAQLSHPNIVKVTDVFEENDTAYYVMDYIEGKSLSKIVDEKGQLSEKEALGYILQVCDALEYVHDQNRLHLDIKPDNIMVNGKGKAILIDFGASKQYDEENGENTSTLIGKTPGYAPIEQMGNNVSHFRPATDIYSVGATLYKCLSGKIPIEPNLRVQGEELEELPSEVSESTKKAIEAAMELNPKKRPQTIKDFVSILSQSNQDSHKSEGTIFDIPEKSAIVNSKSKKESESSSSSTSNKTSNNPNTIESSKAPKSKSSKTNIIIGILAAVIIALVCWIAFGGNNNTSSSQNDEEAISLVGDSLNNSEIAKLGDEGLETNKDLTPSESATPNISETKEPTLKIVLPSNVKVGEEFKVVYRLSNGEGVDFKTKDINGCVKISGPIVSQTKSGLDYTFTYKAEKEGTYTIPSATTKVEGKLVTSNVQKIAIVPVSAQKEPEPTQKEPEPIASIKEPIKEPVIPQEQVILPAGKTGRINGHEWVDLGLPSGLKWATCNIGASSPEKYGNYYAWGETRTKTNYSEDNSETYKKDNEWLLNNGYITSSGVLTLSHDAARQNWGGTWRMPTSKEIDELVYNTTSEWTTLNGVKGRLVKSKKNSNSIFLPAAGTFFQILVTLDGSHGNYWSSSTSSFSRDEPNYADGIALYSNDFLLYRLQSRFEGLTIRPVSE